MFGGSSTVAWAAAGNQPSRPSTECVTGVGPSRRWCDLRGWSTSQGASPQQGKSGPVAAPIVATRFASRLEYAITTRVRCFSAAVAMISFTFTSVNAFAGRRGSLNI
jgi:hypothetical protein